MKFVVVGNSAAGINAVETLRQLNRDADIDIVSDEDAPIYSRCLLSYYLTGSLPKEKLIYRSDSFYRENNVTPHLGTRAVKIDPGNKILYMDNGKQLPYGKLLIATGARSKMPDIPGINLQGIFPLRDIAHVFKI